MMNALLFWLIFLVIFYFAFVLGARTSASRMAAKEMEPPPLPLETLAAYESRLAPMLAVTGHKVAGDVFEFDGRLRSATEEAFRKIRETFAGEAIMPLLMEGEGNNVRVLLVPREKLEPGAASKPKWWLHWLLFGVTMVTTTWAGALHAGVNLLQEPGRFTVGLPYSLALLLILGMHELGHYFTALRHGIRVTPPYFIPVPFALGTFGAFIKIQSLPPNRRALFDVAVAGPLAGLIFAVPALLIGLRYSELIPPGGTIDPEHPGIKIGSSMLLEALAKLSLGPSVTGDWQLQPNPLAFAGWLGLFITALNLLPIGQLDGGHMTHGLFGSRKAHGISVAGLFLVFALALFVWPGLMLWAFIVFFMAGTRDAPAINDVTPVDFARRGLGFFTFLFLLLIIAPAPHTLYEAIGLHSPYM